MNLRSDTILARRESMSSNSDVNSDVNSDEFMDVVDENESINHFRSRWKR